MNKTVDISQQDTVQVALVIHGYEKGLDDLTNKLGLQPDKVVEKGAVERGVGEYKESLWQFNSKLSPNSSAEEHIDWLLNAIRPHKATISQIAQNHKTNISVGTTYYWYNMEIELSPAVMQEIAELGATLWLDMYSFDREFLAEPRQREKFKQTLATSKLLTQLGINHPEEQDAIMEVLYLFEKYKSDTPNEFFPDYGDSSSIDDEDLKTALLNTSTRLGELLAAMKRSQLFSERDKQRPLS